MSTYGVILLALTRGAFGAPDLAAAPAPGDDPPATDAPAAVAPPPDATAVAQAQSVSAAFAMVAEAVSPAAVYIEAAKGPPVATGLEELMREYRLPAPGRAPDGTVSSGSGVIISPDGLVLTNHHVISGATLPVVTLQDKRSFPAEVLGSDARTDIAVLRIMGDGPFAWAQLGDSDKVRVGQWVLAIGHPFDFQFTVTTGIVSARGRRNLFRNEIQDYLQTDAAVNPGSSGGPLFDLAGQVVGINTAIYSPPGGGAQHAGISFAIPSNMARKVADELLRTGQVGRASLGLTTRDRPASQEQPSPGAEVTRVTPRGPAEAAGIRRGDVILSVNGERITGSEDLRGLVLARGVSVDLEVGWERGTQALSALIRTGDERNLSQPDVAIPKDAVEWAGLTVVTATEEGLTEFGVPPPDRPWPGLLVLAVTPGSAAAIAGLEPGDLLIEAGDAPLSRPEDLLAAAKRRRTLTLHFQRDGGESWAAIAGLR